MLRRNLKRRCFVYHNHGMKTLKMMKDSTLKPNNKSVVHFHFPRHAY